MKKFITLFMLLVVALSCSKEQPAEPISSDLSTALEKDEWNIIYFWNGENEASFDFTECSLKFQDNGTVTASHPTYDYQGNWKTIANGGRNYLRLDFSYPDFMKDLNGEWRHHNSIDNQIQFRIDDSNADKVKYLTIERI